MHNQQTIKCVGSVFNVTFRKVQLPSYYYDYYLTAIRLTPGGSSTVHIYTQTVHRIPTKEHT
jgi:hypothetical protein